MGTVHVVGAGLAGLSAAVRLAEAGARVVVHETAKQAGGRCRSYHDAALDLSIDNGNHLLLSGNRSALGFVRHVGGEAALEGPSEAIFHFADLGSGERWQLRPNAGRLPWWVLSPARRVPGTRARDYLSGLDLLRAPYDREIGAAMTCSGPLWERLWHPVLLAALNTEPERGSAGLAAAVVRESLGAGGAACRPIVATGGLSAAFVDPALASLSRSGAEVRFGTRLRSIEFGPDRATALAFSDSTLSLGPDDGLVLAVPPPVAAELVPGLTVPTDFRGIVNGHFRIEPPPGMPLLLGIVGGLSEWLFAYPDRLSVTISAGDRLFETPRPELARQIWSEVAQLAGLPGEPMPRWQIVKERRATFASTPETNRLRPPARTAWTNLALAGDWTATGLPATIEGAIRSGEKAASVLQYGDGINVHRVSKVVS